MFFNLHIHGDTFRVFISGNFYGFYKSYSRSFGIKGKLMGGGAKHSFNVTLKMSCDLLMATAYCLPVGTWQHVIFGLTSQQIPSAPPQHLPPSYLLSCQRGVVFFSRSPCIFLNILLSLNNNWSSLRLIHLLSLMSVQIKPEECQGSGREKYSDNTLICIPF